MLVTVPGPFCAPCFTTLCTLKIIFFQGSQCCGQGKNGKTEAVGYDCVMLPGAMTINKANLADSFCGSNTAFPTVCCKYIYSPYLIMLR